MVFHYKPSILGYPYFWKYHLNLLNFELSLTKLHGASLGRSHLLDSNTWRLPSANFRFHSRQESMRVLGTQQGTLTSTLQGINISHLGKRKIIFKMPCLGDMLVPWRVTSLDVAWVTNKANKSNISMGIWRYCAPWLPALHPQEIRPY